MKFGPCLFLASACVVHAWAQSNMAFGELRGLVTDPQDATVPGASVTVRAATTGLVRQAFTTDSGEYRFLLIPPGGYQVEISKAGFQVQRVEGISVTVGTIEALETRLQLAATHETLVVQRSAPVVDTDRSQQANTLSEHLVDNLPIDRRDYLTFALLAPGIADANTIADNTDLRVKQIPHSGLSFAGSNGRGNSITVDGGESNDGGGGVRSTLPQEAVQEFQINRTNYSAELGGSSGGQVEIVSKSGTSQWHGALFDFLRNEAFDATNPFAAIFTDGVPNRTKPPAKRHQFGGSLGGPLRKDRSFLFTAFEALVRRESSVVSILTDPSIFGPTPAQQEVLRLLPPAQSAALTQVLTASPATRELFASNSGIFPFATDSWRFSSRLDHRFNERHYGFMRGNFSHVDDSNANLQALVGSSRGTVLQLFDPTAAAGWTYIARADFANEMLLQGSYRKSEFNSVERFGPEIRINGFGIFNRDYTLPSNNIERRFDLRDNVTWTTRKHTLKFGGQVLLRATQSDNHVFIGGRFTFGDLPGAVLDPQLPPSFTINALQAFNLGLAQTYQQGWGNTQVASTNPYVGVYVQEGWRLSPTLKLDLGMRYEVDVRLAPVRTDRNNFAPRVGVAWSPGNSKDMVIRAGYGIYYSPIYYQIDWVVNALNEVNGFRPIAQAFTSILTPGRASANNIFATLRAQGIIGVPTPTRSLTPEDVAQFGITFPHTGPLPPFSVLFPVASDYANPYSQQLSVGLDRRLTSDSAVSVSYTRVRTRSLPRARDANLLPAPVDPALGIRVWSDPKYFSNPLIAQLNVFESTATASYHSLIFELTKRFSNRLVLQANYTLSKATDDVTDYSADFEAADQTDLRAEHGPSSFDQRHKFVAFASWMAPRRLTVSPIFRTNSGRPFNLLAGYDLNQDRHDTTDRPPGAGRNTGKGPNFWTVDIRLGREFALSEKGRIQFMAEAFNLFNRTNYSSVNNVVGNMSPPFVVTGREDRLPTESLGFTSVCDRRRLQFGLRLSF